MAATVSLPQCVKIIRFGYFFLAVMSCHLQMSSAKRQPFCFCLNVLTTAVKGRSHITLKKMASSHLRKSYGVTFFSSKHPLWSTVAIMMTSSNGNIYHVTGHLCREFTGPRWIPCTKASDVELWCFSWCALEQMAKQTSKIPVIWDAMAIIVMSL